MKKICIDEGHAGDGIDPGCIGVDGVSEATHAFNIGHTFLNSLLEENGFSVFFTRRWNVDAESDSIAWRASRANVANCDLLVSLHFNAASASAHGIETFYCEDSTEGEKLAKLVNAELITLTGLMDRGIKKDTQAHCGRLGILRQTNCPAILVECGFITNLSENEYVKKHYYTIARAIVRGIKRYYDMGVL